MSNSSSALDTIYDDERSNHVKVSLPYLIPILSLDHDSSMIELEISTQPGHSIKPDLSPRSLNEFQKYLRWVEFSSRAKSVEFSWA